MATLQTTRTLTLPSNPDGAFASCFINIGDIPVDVPSGYTFSSVKFIGKIWLHNSYGGNGTFFIIAGPLGAGDSYSQYRIAAQTEASNANYNERTFTNTNTIFTTKSNWYYSGISKYVLNITTNATSYVSVSWTDSKLVFTYTKTSSSVTAGNIIYTSDFTNSGLSATQGSAIANSNFTKGAVITASAFNGKTFISNTNYTATKVSGW